MATAIEDYINGLGSNLNPDASADVLLMRKSDGTGQKVTIGRVANARKPDPIPIASGSSVDLTATDYNEVTISGSTTITGIVLEEGRVVKATFSGAPKLTYHATNLPILEGKADYQAAAGDIAVIVGGASDVGYVEKIIRATGKSVKPSIPIVRTVARTNITIATDLNNGDTLNGLTLATNDLVLVAGQSTASQNGIYVVGASPARHTDYNTWDAHVSLIVGSRSNLAAYRVNMFICTAQAGGTLGSTSLNFQPCIQDDHASIIFTNGNLYLLDPVELGKIGFACYGETLTADRTIYIRTGDADNILNLPGLVTTLRSCLAADKVYNNTASLATSGLSVTVAASGVYDIELTVHSTSAVKSLNMDFAGTATITNFIGQWIAAMATSGDPVVFNTTRVAAAGTDYTGGADYDGVDAYFTFKGTVEINAAGTFLLRGAQLSADASNTTILRGSSLILTKLN